MVSGILSHLICVVRVAGQQNPTFESVQHVLCLKVVAGVGSHLTCVVQCAGATATAAAEGSTTAPSNSEAAQLICCRLSSAANGSCRPRSCHCCCCCEPSSTPALHLLRCIPATLITTSGRTAYVGAISSVTDASAGTTAATSGSSSTAAVAEIPQLTPCAAVYSPATLITTSGRTAYVGGISSMAG